jgi:hypothetical protein
MACMHVLVNSRFTENHLTCSWLTQLFRDRGVILVLKRNKKTSTEYISILLGAETRLLAVWNFFSQVASQMFASESFSILQKFFHKIVLPT